MPKKNILIAPLDWGLGHSTRCIPIIRLLHQHYKVIIAAEGAQKKLLEDEFPMLTFLPLRGYRARYSKHKRLLPLKILRQLPGLFYRLYAEHVWLQKITRLHQVDLVISDNRFGLWHASIPTIFITHQLQIKGENKWIETLLRKVNYHYVNRFTQCWIPDFAGTPNLAGALSHPVAMPRIPTIYLGALSRLTAQANSLPLYDLLIILSGPEPQRTLLENIVLEQVKQVQSRVLIVRGLPGEQKTVAAPNNVQVQNHLSAAALQQAIASSSMVLSRAGYTTVMDLVKLNKRSILVPTPGQTEQEYLATHLQQQGICFSVSQERFNLAKALQQANSFPFRLPAYDMEEWSNKVTTQVKLLLKEQ